MTPSLDRHAELDRMPTAVGHTAAEKTLLSLPAPGLPARAPRLCALGQTLCELAFERAAADPRTIVVSLARDEAFSKFAERLPDRFFVADADDPGVFDWCFSLAASGARPIVLLDPATLSRFKQEIARELRSHALTLILLVTPAYGTPANHAAINGAGSDYVTRLPNVGLMAARDAGELSAMLSCALQRDSSSIVWLPRSAETANSGAPIHEPKDISWGKSQTIGVGEEVLLVALGDGVEAACQAAKLLARGGDVATVVSLRFLKPLDDETILAAARRARAVVLLEENPALGLAGEVLNLLALHGITRPMSVLLPSSRSRQRSRYGADHPYVRQVVDCCRALLEDSSSESETDPWPAPSGSAPQAPVADIRDLADFRPSSAQVQLELETVLSLELSPAMQQWVAAYEKLGRRSLYLWKWCQQGIELTILPCVPTEWRAHVNDTKLLGVMLDVLLDDVADYERDSILLERLIGLLHNQTSLSEFAPQQLAYAEFTKQVWEEINRRAREYPLYNTYEDLFRYDYLQLINTMRYSNLVNRRLALLNLVEHDLYLPHNMHMIIFSTLDLMCTPHVKPRELGHVREAMWHAQCMGQIGNQITTWQRELDEGDYTSGVFARAITMGDLTVDQLVDGNREQIETAIHRGRHEEHFFQQWKDHRQRLLDLAGKITAFDVATVVGGLDRLMQIELGSRGQR